MSQDQLQVGVHHVNCQSLSSMVLIISMYTDPNLAPDTGT